MYEIVNVQYTGTYNNGGTNIPAVLGEFRATTAADLPAQNVDCHIICGCDGLDIATGDRYIWDGSSWIRQPSDRAFSNVYTKAEIDSMMLSYYTKAEADDLFEWITATITTDALPLTFKADGSPIISWSMKGNGQQTGTPTPDNPVMPTFCGVRTGNLFNMSFYEGKSGITVSGNKATGTCDRFFNIKISIPSELYGQEVTWSAFIKRPDSPSTVRLQTVDNGSYKYGNNITGEGRSTVSFTATSTIRLYVNYGSTGTDTIELSDITLNLGSTALPYEPYGYKIPLTCAGQTVPVYLGQTQTVRRVKKLVLTGTENWTISGGWKKAATSVFYMALADIIHVSADNAVFIYSNAFAAATQNGLYNGDSDMIARTGTEALTIRVSDSIATTVADFKAYLASEYAAGHPVTVWYVLSTPTTGIVNEPLCKIGTYADEISSTDAGVAIPTVRGQNVLTVNTTLQPSEITITGKIR